MFFDGYEIRLKSMAASSVRLIPFFLEVQFCGVGVGKKVE